MANERHWIVLDDGAVPLARMKTGSSKDILEIGSDYVLVRQQDDFGVERLAMFGIEPG